MDLDLYFLITIDFYAFRNCLQWQILFHHVNDLDVIDLAFKATEFLCFNEFCFYFISEKPIIQKVK